MRIGRGEKCRCFQAFYKDLSMHFKYSLFKQWEDMNNEF